MPFLLLFIDAVTLLIVAFCVLEFEFDAVNVILEF